MKIHNRDIVRWLKDKPLIAGLLMFISVAAKLYIAIGGLVMFCLAAEGSTPIGLFPIVMLIASGIIAVITEYCFDTY